VRNNYFKFKTIFAAIIWMYILRMLQINLSTTPPLRIVSVSEFNFFSFNRMINKVFLIRIPRDHVNGYSNRFITCNVYMR